MSDPGLIRILTADDHAAERHRPANALDKLSANDRTHAVTIALKRGIIDF